MSSSDSNVQKTVQILKDNMDDLARHERAKVQRIFDDIEGSYPDDEQLEYIENLAERFA